MSEGVFLTEEQRLELDAKRLDFERHNVWRLLSKDGTNGWKYPCLCSRCQSGEMPEPDVREG